MKKLILLLSVFMLGSMGNEMVKVLVPVLQADVAGMSYYDLRSDYDFKKAVKYIIERCEVEGNGIDC